jgi:hypothetical protein
VVTCNQNSIECKETDLGAFLGIEEASERIFLAAMIQAAARHGTEPAICRWICSMLESRNIMTTFTGEHLSGPTAGGCLKGCVITSSVESGHGQTLTRTQ